MHVLAAAAMYEQQQLVANVVAVCHPSGGRGQGDGGSVHVCISARRQIKRGTGVWSQNLDRSAADSRRRGKANFTRSPIDKVTTATALTTTARPDGAGPTARAWLAGPTVL